MIARQRLASAESRLAAFQGCATLTLIGVGGMDDAAESGHGISSGQFHTWRKQFRTGELTGFVPVSVVPDPPVNALLAGKPPSVVDRRCEGSEPASIEVEVQSTPRRCGK